MIDIKSDRIKRGLMKGHGVTDYTSNILKLFMEQFESRPGGSLLDIGPVCQENIRFFAHRVRKHHICDMFIRLDRCLRSENPVHQIWRELDYPPESFDGILMWELPDRLADEDVNTLVQLCHTLLKPGGMAVVMVMGEQSQYPEPHAFVVEKNFRVHLRPQSHLNLPLRGRQNRDVLTMMTPFNPAKSFICRPGFMEFLFKRS